MLTHWLLYVVAVAGCTAAGMRILNRFIGLSRNMRVRKIMAVAVYIGMFFYFCVISGDRYI